MTAVREGGGGAMLFSSGSRIAVDVYDLLTQLGIRNVQPSEGEVVFSCPFPEGHKHGDQRPSASMNAETTAWHCHGCHRSGNALTLTSTLLGVNPMQASLWLREAYGSRSDTPTLEDVRARLDHLVEMEPVPDEGLPEFPVEDDLLRFREWPVEAQDYMLSRRFMPSILKFYDVRYDIARRRVVLLIKDEHGRVVGAKGRAIDDYRDPKYMIYDPTYPQGKVVYLLDSVEGDHLIVCEGELNALRMRQFGYANAVGIGGSLLSRAHIALLISRASTVTLFFDSDQAGEAGAIKAGERLSRMVGSVRIVGPHEGDACTMTYDEIEHLLETTVTTLEYKEMT